MQDSIVKTLTIILVCIILLWVVLKIKSLDTKSDFLQKQLESARKENSRLQKEINELKEERKESD